MVWLPEAGSGQTGFLSHIVFASLRLMCIFKHISGLSVWVGRGRIPVILTSLWKWPAVSKMAPEWKRSIPHGNGLLGRKEVKDRVTRTQSLGGVHVSLYPSWCLLVLCHRAGGTGLRVTDLGTLFWDPGMSNLCTASDEYEPLGSNRQDR